MKIMTRLKSYIFIIIVCFSKISCQKDNFEGNESYKKSDIKFNNSLTYGSVTDIEGNIYRTIQIGNQIWMAENLRTSKFNDGTEIPFIAKYDSWSHLTSPAYCWFRNDEKNKYNYGALYNWYAVNTGKLAPKGWRVATDTDWTELTYYLGGESVAGGKLKEQDTLHWKNNSMEATNESGFSALPGGHRDADGGFFGHQNEALWWCSTEWPEGNKFAYIRSIYHSNSLDRAGYHKSGGKSVRCIKD